MISQSNAPIDNLVRGDIAEVENPEFTEASERANIVSGESIPTLFGKIKKFFTDLKAVAFSGSYNDLSNKPTIPTVNNGTLTIQKNGTNVATFTANQSSDATANITVPTNTNQLTNGAGFITSSGSCNYANSAGSAGAVAWGNVTGTKPNINLGHKLLFTYLSGDQTITATSQTAYASSSVSLDAGTYFVITTTWAQTSGDGSCQLQTSIGNNWTDEWITSYGSPACITYFGIITVPSTGTVSVKVTARRGNATHIKILGFHHIGVWAIKLN